MNFNSLLITIVVISELHTWAISILMSSQSLALALALAGLMRTDLWREEELKSATHGSCCWLVLQLQTFKLTQIAPAVSPERICAPQWRDNNGDNSTSPVTFADSQWFPGHKPLTNRMPWRTKRTLMFISLNLKFVRSRKQMKSSKCDEEKRLK